MSAAHTTPTEEVTMSDVAPDQRITADELAGLRRMAR